MHLPLKTPLYILLIEDDEDDQLFFKNALHSIHAGIRCEMCQHGEAALHLLRHATDLPDLIIMDLNMPVLNGHDTLRLLRTNSRYDRVPVLLTSTASHDTGAMRQLGAVDFMEKPNSYYKLREMLEKILQALFDEKNPEQ